MKAIIDEDLHRSLVDHTFKKQRTYSEDAVKMRAKIIHTPAHNPLSKSSDLEGLTRAVVNPVFPNLKFSTRSITIRMTESLIDNLKVIANKKDVPYQSLIKEYIRKGVFGE